MPPIIDYEKCIGCGICASICPTQVFRTLSGESKPKVFFGDECWHCNSCVLDCKQKAVSLRVPLTHSLLHVDAASLKPKQ